MSVSHYVAIIILILNTTTALVNQAREISRELVSPDLGQIIGQLVAYFVPL